MQILKRNLILFRCPQPYPQPASPPTFSCKFCVSRKLGQGEGERVVEVLSHWPHHTTAIVCSYACRALYKDGVHLEVRL